MTARRRLWQLGGLVLVSEAVYLAAVVRLPWWRFGGHLQSWRLLLSGPGGPPPAGWRSMVACLAGLALLLGLFVLALRLPASGELPRWAIWLGAGLFGVTLIWLLPITSDLFSYLSQAHQMTDLGVNPLRTAVLDSPPDALLLAYPTAYALTPSVYGPAWILLASLGTLGRHDVVGGTLYLKVLAFAAYLVSVGLLTKILGEMRPGKRLAEAKPLLLFAWNPLVLLMAVGDGHNDITMMALVLLSLSLLVRKRWVLAIGALTLSVWVKYMSLVFVPLFLIYALRGSGGGAREAPPARDGRSVSQSPDRGGHDRHPAGSWAWLVLGGALSLGVSVAVLLPFGRLDWLVGAIVRLLHPDNVRLAGAGGGTPVLVAGLALFCVFFLIVTRSGLRGRLSFQGLADTAFVVSLLAFALGTARSQPWHLLWPATLAPLSTKKWAGPLVVGLSALMLFAQVWVEWGAPGLSIFDYGLGILDWSC